MDSGSIAASGIELIAEIDERTVEISSGGKMNKTI
jgi:hypothetical protein